MDAAVSYALNKGVSVVVSAGNDGANGDPVEWPAAAPGVIAVAAVDADGVRPAWSSTGAHVAVSAPGVHILSTVPGGGYESWSGTSMAAPFVSAAAALLRHAGVLTPAAVRSRLMATADDLGAPGFDPQYGAGRINVVAAEGLASSPAAPPAAAPDPVAAEPAPVGAPVGAPVEAPAADPAAVGSEPAPDLSQPADAPAVVVADGARVAASRPRTGYRAPVYVSTRALSGGQPAADVPVRLERSTPGGWAVIRTGVTDAVGLLSWQLRPDRTASYRAVGAGFASAPVSVAVAPIRISRQVRSRAR